MAIRWSFLILIGRPKPWKPDVILYTMHTKCKPKIFLIKNNFYRDQMIQFLSTMIDDSELSILVSNVHHTDSKKPMTSNFFRMNV